MIDAIDQQILMILQDAGRTSHAEIGRSLGMAASAIFERVKKLEERGFIQGYAALVDPAIHMTHLRLTSSSLLRMLCALCLILFGVSVHAEKRPLRQESQELSGARTLIVKAYLDSSGKYMEFKLDRFDQVFSNTNARNQITRWGSLQQILSSPRKNPLLATDLIVEYIALDNKSYFQVADVPDAVFIDSISARHYEELQAVFPIGIDGRGYRVYSSTGKILGEQLFNNIKEPSVCLELLSNRYFVLHVEGGIPSDYVSTQWSLDSGRTWSNPTVVHPEEKRVQIPEHVLAKKQQILLEFDIPVGLTIFRKRFIYGNDGHPLRGTFPPHAFPKSEISEDWWIN